MSSSTFQKQYSQYEDAMTSFLQVDLAPLNTVQRKFCISILYVNFPGLCLIQATGPISKILRVVSATTLPRR